MHPLVMFFYLFVYYCHPQRIKGRGTGNKHLIKPTQYQAFAKQQNVTEEQADTAESPERP